MAVSCTFIFFFLSQTRNHNWNIFVNPVGVDATVAQTATRCVAGGYIWNPFYTQLADPLNVIKCLFFFRFRLFLINNQLIISRLTCIEKSVDRTILCDATLVMFQLELERLVRIAENTRIRTVVYIRFIYRYGRQT